MDLNMSNSEGTEINSLDETNEPKQTHEVTIKSINQQIQSNKNKRIFKIIVIGDSNVGKTCLTFRFCGGKFPTTNEATIGVDFREKQIKIDDECITMLIWDTAGQERFRKSMVAHYYRNVHAVIFVYDVTNMQSFENLAYWIDECNRLVDVNSQIPRIIVGNKCDLVDQKRLDTSIAQSFADMHHMPLFETSAIDDSKQDHVEAIFMTLAHKLINSKPFFIPNENTRLNNTASNSRKNNHSSCFC